MCTFATLTLAIYAALVTSPGAAVQLAAPRSLDAAAAQTATANPSSIDAAVDQSGAAAPPSIDAQVVFLYYKDIEAAAAFYGGTLGLDKTFDEAWVKIYRTSPDSYVGLVDETRGAHTTAEEKPVMLSIVTGEVDAWYRYLEAAGVEFLGKLSDSRDAPIRSFIVADPGGYTVEFFQWLQASNPNPSQVQYPS